MPNFITYGIYSCEWFGNLRGFFECSKSPFDPKIALRCAQDNLGVKKILAPSKNTSKSPIMCFCSHKKITSRMIKKEEVFVKIVVNDCVCIRSVERSQRTLSVQNTAVRTSFVSRDGLSVLQCGGSGMFIPDPTFFHPGSELSPSRIPDPHQRI